MGIDVEKLPARIKGLPHWRVNFRPAKYDEKPIGIDPAKAFHLIEQTKVSFSGWRYPFVSREMDEQIRQEKYIASGCDWGDIVEYWRYYYSGQFIHLFAVWERMDEKLKEHTRSWVLRGYKTTDNGLNIVDISNVLIIMTKIFEFATRLCEKSVYEDKLLITVSLENINGHVLTANLPHLWHGYYPSTTDRISKTWEISVIDLLAKHKDYSLAGMINIFKYFGWDDPSEDILRKEQEKFLAVTSRRK